MAQGLITIQTSATLNDKGRATSSFDKYKLEIIGALANEKVEGFICGGSKREKIFKTSAVLEPSIDRCPARCSHVPECGGCAFQYMKYGSQLTLKEDKIKELFKPYNPHFYPILGCLDPFYYRNKMEFSFSSDKEGNPYLGLIQAASRGRVINIFECQLVNPWMAKVLEAVRAFWKASGLQAYDRQDKGTFRTLTLREGFNTCEKMVILTVSGNPTYALNKAQLNAFKQAVIGVLGEEVSVFLIIQQIAKGTPTQFFEMHLHGKDHIREKLSLFGREYVFKISPTSFFQPNTKQAEKLYERAIGLLGHNMNIEHALDLFSGTSTFSIALSHLAKKVTAIEINPHAVFDAAENLENNAICNVELLQGDVVEKLKEVKKNVDVVALDPPRAGIGIKGLAIILSIKPKKILYISCNPKTQALDAEGLLKGGYTLKSVQPIDQFPHTAHCENICIFERSC